MNLDREAKRTKLIELIEEATEVLDNLVSSAEEAKDLLDSGLGALEDWPMREDYEDADEFRDAKESIVEELAEAAGPMQEIADKFEVLKELADFLNS